MTHGCRVIAVLPIMESLPAAATMIVPRAEAWSRAFLTTACSAPEALSKAALKFTTWAPALTQSTIAAARLPAVATGTAAADSSKIGRSRIVQPGQIAGAAEPRLEARMPATNVPCVQAKLECREQANEEA